MESDWKRGRKLIFMHYIRCEVHSALSQGKRQKAKGKRQKEGTVSHLRGAFCFALTMIAAMIRFSSSASCTNAGPDSPGLSPDSMSSRNQ